MRHVSLTCKNHPELRWSAKSIAVNTDGSYNGERGILFKGQVSNPITFHNDMSGVETNLIVNDKIIDECSCSSSDITFAPEDIQLRDAYIAKYKTNEYEPNNNKRS